MEEYHIVKNRSAAQLRGVQKSIAVEHTSPRSLCTSSPEINKHDYVLSALSSIMFMIPHGIFLCVLLCWAFVKYRKQVTSVEFCDLRTENCTLVYLL